jgi:quercetin dioxygenase-like cupin family protein
MIFSLLMLMAAPPMVVVNERDVVRQEAPPHGAIGMSTAYRISDIVPQPRTMEFRKRVLHKGAAIGLHPIAHDEVYYVLSGEGEVTSDGVSQRLKPGMAVKNLYNLFVSFTHPFSSSPSIVFSL